MAKLGNGHIYIVDSSVVIQKQCCEFSASAFSATFVPLLSKAVGTNMNCFPKTLGQCSFFDR